MLSFDVVDNNIPLFLGKETLKNWIFTIFPGNDSAELTSNNNAHKAKLYTSSSRHWCLHVCYVFQ